jgi:hypothetical protein
MGSPRICNMLDEFGVILLFDNWVDTIPGSFKFTACIPKKCGDP